MRRVLALVFLILAIAAPANAHNELVSANPSADAVLQDFPTEISLKFSEDLILVGNENPNTVEVKNGAGEIVSGAVVVNGATISAPLTIVGNDQFTVSYRVASKDGHVVEGTYSFSVGSPMVISAPVEAAEDGPNLLVRLVELLVIGGLGFVAFISLRKVRSSIG